MGQRREKRWFSLPGVTGKSRLQLARASHPVCVWGHWADTASPFGAQAPLLERASPGTFLLGHRHGDGF